MSRVAVAWRPSRRRPRSWAWLSSWAAEGLGRAPIAAAGTRVISPCNLSPSLLHNTAMMPMLRRGLRWLLSWKGRLLLSLRYRVEVRGLDEIRKRGTSRVLFLPSHLALIDPAILMVIVNRGFRPRALADEYPVSYT